MADIPLAFNFQGDYGYKVIIVDDGDDIATVVKKASAQMIGVLIKPPPEGAVFSLRIQGADAPLPDDITVRDAGLVEMEAVEIYRTK